MKSIKKILSAAVACAVLASPVTQLAFAAPPSGSTYVVDGAKVHYHYSQIVGQLYEFNVALPPSYASDPNREYPVLYVLDGQWDFTLVKDIVGKTNYDGMVPDVITVAITWGGHNDDPNVLRARDYVPSEFPFIANSGGASNFLNALENELMPYIDSLYRTNDQSVLMGSSFGGLFTSFAMFERPDLFDGYIAMAAPYGLEAPYFINKLEETRGTDYFDNIKAYVGSGTLDGNSEPVRQFAEALQSGDYAGLSVEYSTPENLGHSAGSIVGYTEGLQYIFKRPELSVPEPILAQYVGQYINDADNGFPPVGITIVNGQIALQFPGQPDQPFAAESEAQFYLKGTNVKLEFIEGENGWNLIIDDHGNRFPFTQALN